MSLWIALALWVVIGLITAYLADSRGRSPFVWFFWGALFGWLGLILVLVLPPIKTSEPTSEKPLPLPPVLEIPSYESATGWFFLDSEKGVCGPVTGKALRDMWKEGRVSESSWVWNESIVDWKRLSSVEGLLQWLKSETKEQTR